MNFTIIYGENIPIFSLLYCLIALIRLLFIYMPCLSKYFWATTNSGSTNYTHEDIYTWWAIEILWNLTYENIFNETQKCF